MSANYFSSNRPPITTKTIVSTTVKTVPRAGVMLFIMSGHRKGWDIG